MRFPLNNYKFEIPAENDPGGFGYIRKYDIHTGVDLYCENLDRVYAMEDGDVVAVEKFTGKWAGSPWWNNTEAVLIEGKSGVILYGEIIYLYTENTKRFKEGDLIGVVKQVLKKDKGKNPLSMLHMELYKHGTKESVIWGHNDEDKPSNLLDITRLLNQLER